MRALFLIVIACAASLAFASCTPKQERPIKHLAPVSLYVAPDGRAYWNNAPLDNDADLRKRLTMSVKQDPELQIEFAASAHARYEDVIRIVTIMRESGVRHTGVAGIEATGPEPHQP